MKKFRILLALMLALVLCAGCAGSGAKVAKPTIDHPPYCAEILEMLGKPLSEVLPALGLKAEDFTDNIKNGRWYILNEPVDFLGYKFELRLSVHGKDAESAAAVAVCYILKAETPEVGAEITTDLRDKLLKGYGKAFNGAKHYSGNYEVEATNPPSPLNTYTKEDLLKRFTEDDNPTGGSLEWLLSVDLSNVPSELLDATAYAGLRATCITATLSAAYPVTDVPESGETPHALIRLVYGLSHSYRDLSK